LVVKIKSLTAFDAPVVSTAAFETVATVA